MLEDKLLIWKFRSGDSNALARIYEKYKDALLKIASGLLNQNNAAEDIVHEVFVSLAKSYKSLRPEGNLRSFLVVCVANRARNINKAGSRRQVLNILETESIAPDSRQPDRWIIQNEELCNLNNALAELPYNQREVILLHVHGDMKFRAIAKSLNVSVNTVLSRYRYGLKKLRSLLNGQV